MWTRTYLILLAVRLYFAVSPSFIHPDENFQGPEVIAGKLSSLSPFIFHVFPMTHLLVDLGPRFNGPKAPAAKSGERLRFEPLSKWTKIPMSCMKSVLLEMLDR